MYSGGTWFSSFFACSVFALSQFVAFVLKLCERPLVLIKSEMKGSLFESFCS